MSTCTVGFRIDSRERQRQSLVGRGSRRTLDIPQRHRQSATKSCSRLKNAPSRGYTLGSGSARFPVLSAIPRRNPSRPAVALSSFGSLAPPMRSRFHRPQIPANALPSLDRSIMHCLGGIMPTEYENYGIDHRGYRLNQRQGTKVRGVWFGLRGQHQRNRSHSSNKTDRI
jgi:hypothetical protein